MKGYHKEKCFGKYVWVQNGINLGWDGRVIVLGQKLGMPAMVTGFVFVMLIVILVTLITIGIASIFI